MKKGKTFRQMLDIYTKIFIAFILVFIMYIIGKSINLFIYSYFIFPFLSIIIIFLCGVKVGKALEKIKDNKSIGVFTKEKETKKSDNNTEFVIKDEYEIITNKKILKEIEDGEKVHVKIFNYDDIYNKEEIK